MGRDPRRWYSYGPDVNAWIEANCVLPSGERIGRPFRLMPWQKDWINELYACDAKGTLRYRWSLLGIPKKNGKSTMIAALALYHLMADPDEADPWAVCAAASDRQADLVFNAAKLMCELSPALREATDRYRWEIRPKGRPGRLELVAASAGKLDGKNISFLVVDELHEWNLENWAILTNGTVGRRRAQIVQITTAGHDLETICGREFVFHFGIDPRFLERTRQVLEADGLSVEEVPQSDSRMVPASQLLYELVVQGNVEHEGNAAFTRHIESAVARRRPSRGSSSWDDPRARIYALHGSFSVATSHRLPAAGLVSE
jgi:phage terminase large subunit-like protein